MIVTAKIVGFDGEQLVIKPNSMIDRELLQKNVDLVEVRLVDGREISAEQRKKAYATLNEIAKWSGTPPEMVKDYLKFIFCGETGEKWFSLSDCTVSTAREFITYLINFCFRFGVPTQDSLLDRTDDISKYLYLCLEHRKCAICNARAEVHHIDTVGMGNNRNSINHIGKEAIALCRKHHREAHTKGKQFLDDNHIYGIKLDEYLCKKLKLRGKK